MGVTMEQDRKELIALLQKTFFTEWDLERNWKTFVYLRNRGIKDALNMGFIPTNHSGRYMLTDPDNPACMIEISKEGYRFAMEYITPEKEDHHEYIL